MAKVILCSAAEQEYAEALTWYVERSVKAAEKFDAELDHAMRSIASHPNRFPRCDDRSAIQRTDRGAISDDELVS